MKIIFRAILGFSFCFLTACDPYIFLRINGEKQAKVIEKNTHLTIEGKAIGPVSFRLIVTGDSSCPIEINGDSLSIIYNGSSITHNMQGVHKKLEKQKVDFAIYFAIPDYRIKRDTIYISTNGFVSNTDGSPIVVGALALTIKEEDQKWGGLHR